MAVFFQPTRAEVRVTEVPELTGASQAGPEQPQTLWKETSVGRQIERPLEPPPIQVPGIELQSPPERSKPFSFQSGAARAAFHTSAAAVMPEAGVSGRMLLEGGLIEILEIKTRKDQLLKANIEPLGERAAFISFSGRGERDLATIISDKRGSYLKAGDHYLMVYTLDRLPESPEQTVRELCCAAYKAFIRATLTNDQRTAVDPNPGGIIMLERPAGQRVDTSVRAGWSSPLSSIGEATVPLEPRDWNDRYRGVIPFSAFQDLHSALLELRGRWESLNDGRSVQREQAMQTYQRLNLAPELIGQRILAEALKMLR